MAMPAKKKAQKPTALERRVAACFRYEGPEAERSRKVAANKLPKAVAPALLTAKKEVIRGDGDPEWLEFEGFYALLGLRNRKTFAWAVFAADRHINYTWGRYIAFTPTGRRICDRLEVGD
ncbi:MAG: hypothetical protein QM765_05215 [Myxococcales bacterium]